MFGIVSKLFGSSKSGEKLIEGAMSGIDKIWYTDEEKADDIQAAKRNVMTVYTKWLESTSSSRIARRVLAIGVFSMWALEHTTALGFRAASTFTNDTGVITAAKFQEVALMLSNSADEMQPLVAFVFAFYFGGPVLVDASAGLLKTWASPKNKGETK
jgi:hypothetical protein